MACEANRLVFDEKHVLDEFDRLRDLTTGEGVPTRQIFILGGHGERHGSHPGHCEAQSANVDVATNRTFALR